MSVNTRSRLQWSVVTTTRTEQKERTRRAILDAALTLCEGSSLVALSLRAVAKEVGIVPTAFYRHFDSIEALGLALVEESFTSLRAMLRDVRRGSPAYGDIVDSSVEVLRAHVAESPRHFAFIARERAAGPPSVRAEIRHQISLVERELATDLALLPGTEKWSSEDLRMVSGLIVTAMVATAEELIDRPAEAAEISRIARRRLLMVLIGALQWESY